MRTGLYASSSEYAKQNSVAWPKATQTDAVESGAEERGGRRVMAACLPVFIHSYHSRTVLSMDADSRKFALLHARSITSAL